MKLKISPLVAVMAAVAVLTDGWREMAAAYILMTAHEAAHLAAASAIGLVPESFEFAPFGVHLRLKNRIVLPAADEVILYAAGPLFNGIAAVLFKAFGFEKAYAIDLPLFIMNLLPVLPLDGGMIAKRLIACRFGGRAARRALMFSSAVLGISFAAAAALGIYRGELNPSVAAIALFLLGSVLTAREKYDADMIIAASGAKKRSNRARLVIVDGENTYLKAAKTIDAAYTTFAVVTDKDGRVKHILGEGEIIKNAAKG